MAPKVSRSETRSELLSPKGSSADGAKKPKAKSRPVSQDEVVAEGRTKGGEDQWEYRNYKSRCWGHTLKKAGGSNSNSVKKLTATLRDARASSETALRRTAIEALVPAAAVGNRGALMAQAKALGDPEGVVQRTALRCLQKAAGGKRGESGGAVSIALAQALPSFSGSENAEVRRSAATALARLTPQQDSELANIALSWIDDEDYKVRSESAQALGIAGCGPEALEALKQSLTDVDWRVSQASVHALSKLSMTGSASSGGRKSRSRSGTGGSRPRTNASSDASAALADSSTPAEVLAECCRSNLLRGLPRVDAVRALGKVAVQGDKSALLVAANQLTDVDAQVRRAAVGALKQMAPGDRSGTIRATASQLYDVDFRVRERAGEALSVVSKASNDLAFTLAATALEADDWRGRRGAASALRRLGQLDNGNARESVFSVLIPRLEHPDWSIRRKGAQALGVVAKGLGDMRAIKLLAGLARDPDEEVRIAVVEALPGAAPLKKCKEAIVMAATFAKDSNPRIRLAAINALEELASEQRSRSRVAVHAVSGCVQDEVEEVRLAAERVMQSIAKGRRTAIDDIAERLQDPDEGVRHAAMEAFKGIGRTNPDRALKRAIPLLRHHDAGVRQAASEAMQGMMSPEEAAVVASAAMTVGRFRRRFPKPAGYANSDYESSEEEEDTRAGSHDHLEEKAAEIPEVQGSLQAVRSQSRSTTRTDSAPPPEPPKSAERMAAEKGQLDALLAGDLSRATTANQELLELVEEEEAPPPKTDTDTESELSESDTDLDTDPEAASDEEGSRANESNQESSNSKNSQNPPRGRGAPLWP